MTCQRSELITNAYYTDEDTANEAKFERLLQSQEVCTGKEPYSVVLNKFELVISI